MYKGRVSKDYTTNVEQRPSVDHNVRFCPKGGGDA